MNQHTTRKSPVLSYYGDDFTGSTDVMEAMASNGFNSVLFLGIPDKELLSRFKNCSVIGIAGTSRSESPEWMEKNLGEIFTWLRELKADFCHYKVCSTFDSSPDTGSIGKAVEMGKSVFMQKFVPLVVGAPQLKRYTAFGHLFAGYQGENFRIDRHPVMSRHPVTPMCEADLREHLALQTELGTDLIDLVALKSDQQQLINTIIDNANGIVLFDVNDQESQRLAGQHLHSLEDIQFVAGSSGIEYALLAHLKHTGELSSLKKLEPVADVDQIAVVSGSVSPTTQRQILHASDNGFDCISADPLDLVGSNAPAAIDAIVNQANDVLSKGRSPIVHTALGPTEDKGNELDRQPDARHRIGQALGTILRRLIEQHKLTRAVIAGGDTSSHALQELNVEALTLKMPIPSTPGSPLCVCHGTANATDGLEIALKGGQVGLDNYFSMIRSPRQTQKAVRDPAA